MRVPDRLVGIAEGAAIINKCQRRGRREQSLHWTAAKALEKMHLSGQ
jgi:hypothetical protein